MIDHNEINRIKFTLLKAYENNEKPASIDSTDGQHGLMWEQDLDGLDYVLVGCVLPEGVYADFLEGTDSTYGALGALRIYLQNEKETTNGN